MNNILKSVLLVALLSQNDCAYQPYKDTEPDYAASVHHLKLLVKWELILLPIVQSAMETEISEVRESEELQSYLQDFYISNIFPLPGEIQLTQFVSLLRQNFVSLENFADDVVKHPLKSYRTIRRFTTFISNFPNMTKDEALLDALNKSKRNIQYPKETDLATAMQNILRLTQIFRLSANDLIAGRLEDLETKSGLTIQQLLEIADHAKSLKIYTHALDFYVEVRARCEGVGHNYEPTQCFNIDIHRIEKQMKDVIQAHDELLSEGLEQKQNVDLTTMPPDSSPFVFNGPLESLTSIKFINRTHFEVEKELNAYSTHPSHSTKLERDIAISPFIYEKLCRGELMKSENELASLHCHLLHSSHPTFLIGPLKIEVHNKEPTVIQVYDVLSNKEIVEMQAEVGKEMRQSRTATTDHVKGVTSRYRTSANSWIEDNKLEKFQYLNNRVSHITGLNTTGFYSSEIVQIAAYTPGGHYTPHSDAIFEEGIKDILPESEFIRGDRIITFMIYLSNVERGGGTSFPVLKTVVQPVKGSAVIWHNLRSDGSINYDVFHGGCPVLIGTKWIANKWIRSNDQMFIEKCSTSNASSS